MPCATILVVERDSSIRALFEEVLQTAGYNVQHSAAETLSPAALEAAPPDLLLLELTPADVRSRLGLIAAMRRRLPPGQLPVVVSATDFDLLDRHDASLRYLQCELLLKPFDIDQLLQLVGERLDVAA